MAIKPVCDKELIDCEVIIFSPPYETSQVTKFHLYQACYKIIVETFEN